jgi:hypothetical protein
MGVYHDDLLYTSKIPGLLCSVLCTQVLKLAQALASSSFTVKRLISRSNMTIDSTQSRRNHSSPCISVQLVYPIEPPRICDCCPCWKLRRMIFPPQVPSVDDKSITLVYHHNKNNKDHCTRPRRDFQVVIRTRAAQLRT